MEVFEAIAQPKRREILRLLSGRELSAGEIASRFAVTQPAISQHLKVLKDVGLVSERREGNEADPERCGRRDSRRCTTFSPRSCQPSWTG